MSGYNEVKPEIYKIIDIEKYRMLVDQCDGIRNGYIKAIRVQEWHLWDLSELFHKKIIGKIELDKAETRNRLITSIVENPEHK